MTEFLPLQTAGGGPSLGLILLLAGAAIFAVGRFTSLSPLGWLRGGLRMVPGVGGSGGGLLPNLGPWRGVLLAGVVIVLALIIGGALDLPGGSGVQVVVMLELAGAYLLLRSFDAYSFRAFAVVAAATVVLGLSAMGEPVIGAIASSDVFPIVVIGGLVLAWQAIDAYRKSSRPKIIYRRGGGR